MIEKNRKENSGEVYGTTDLTDRLLLADFIYVRDLNRYVHMPTCRVYTADEINRLILPVPVLADESSSSCH
jgi:hypothetical protein